MFLNNVYVSHKNANASADKAAEAQRQGVWIMTVWSPGDAGKSEVDPRGANYTKCAREELVEECLEKFQDPRCCRNLTGAFNAKHRKPKAPRKDSRIEDRFAVHVPADDIKQLRYRLPAWHTLVTSLF